MLFADERGELLLVLLHQLAEARQDARAAQRRGGAPRGERRGRRLRRPHRRRAALANGTVRITSPVAGLVTSPRRVPCGATARPLIHSGIVASDGEAGLATGVDIVLLRDGFG